MIYTGLGLVCPVFWIAARASRSSGPSYLSGSMFLSGGFWRNDTRLWSDSTTRPEPRLSLNTDWPAQIRPSILSTLLSAQELAPRFFSMASCTQEQEDLRVSSATLQSPKPAHFVPVETADAWKRWFPPLRL